MLLARWAASPSTGRNPLHRQSHPRPYPRPSVDLEENVNDSDNRKQEHDPNRVDEGRSDNGDAQRKDKNPQLSMLPFGNLEISRHDCNRPISKISHCIVRGSDREAGLALLLEELGRRGPDRTVGCG